MCVFNYLKYSYDSATLVGVFTVSNVAVSVFRYRFLLSVT